MIGQITVIHPDGSTTKTHCMAKPHLRQLQDAVGGMIQLLPGFENFQGQPCVAFCNEEFLFERLPFNFMATMMWRRCFEADTRVDVQELMLCGPVAVVTGDNEFLEAL